MSQASKQTKKLIEDLIILYLLLNRLSSHYSDDARTTLRMLERELLREVSYAFPRGFAVAPPDRIMILFGIAQKSIETHYAKLRDKLLSDLAEVGIFVSERDIENIAGELGIKLKPADRLSITASIAKILIAGATINDWIERQAGDLLFRFKRSIQVSASAADTLSKSIERLSGTPPMSYKDGIINRSENAAEATIRTAVNGAADVARMETYKLNGKQVNAIQQISILDGRTSEICLSYAFKKWALPDLKPIGHSLPYQGGPPRHFNCRSFIVPIVEGADSVDSFDVETWLELQPHAMQESILGKGKAELFRKGKLAIDKLLDQSGRPLTLAELKNS